MSGAGLVELLAARLAGRGARRAAPALREALADVSSRGIASEPNPIMLRVSDLPERGVDAAKVREYGDMLSMSEPPPILVARRPGQSWEIMDGHHRAAAMRQAGRQEVPAIDISERVGWGASQEAPQAAPSLRGALAEVNAARTGRPVQAGNAFTPQVRSGPDAGPSQAGRDAEIAAAEDHFERMRRIGSAYDVSLAEQRLAAARSASPDGRPVQAGRDPGTYRDLDLGDGNVVNFRAVESDPMHREIHWDISDVRGYGDDVEALAQQERDIRRRLDFTPGLRSTEEGQALQRQVSEIAARRREAQVSDGAGSKSYVHAFRAVERALNEELSANAGRGVTYEFYPDKAGLQPIYEAWARRFQHPDYRIEKAEVGYRLVPTNSSRAGPNAGSDRNALQRALRERMNRE